MSSGRKRQGAGENQVKGYLFREYSEKRAKYVGTVSGRIVNGSYVLSAKDSVRISKKLNDLQLRIDSAKVGVDEELGSFVYLRCSPVSRRLPAQQVSVRKVSAPRRKKAGKKARRIIVKYHTEPIWVDIDPDGTEGAPLIPKGFRDKVLKRRFKAKKAEGLIRIEVDLDEPGARRTGKGFRE